MLARAWFNLWTNSCVGTGIPAMLATDRIPCVTNEPGGHYKMESTIPVAQSENAKKKPLTLWGMFASKPYNVGDIMGAYPGEVKSADVAKHLKDEGLDSHCITLISQQSVLDGIRSSQHPCVGDHIGAGINDGMRDGARNCTIVKLTFKRALDLPASMRFSKSEESRVATWHIVHVIVATKDFVIPPPDSQGNRYGVEMFIKYGEGHWKSPHRKVPFHSTRTLSDTARISFAYTCPGVDIKKLAMKQMAKMVHPSSKRLLARYCCPLNPASVVRIPVMSGVRSSRSFPQPTKTKRQKEVTKTRARQMSLIDIITKTVQSN
jgi:hypothetical protein